MSEFKNKVEAERAEQPAVGRGGTVSRRDALIATASAFAGALAGTAGTLAVGRGPSEKRVKELVQEEREQHETDLKEQVKKQLAEQRKLEEQQKRVEEHSQMLLEGKMTREQAEDNDRRQGRTNDQDKP